MIEIPFIGGKEDGRIIKFGSIEDAPLVWLVPEFRPISVKWNDRYEETRDTFTFTEYHLVVLCWDNPPAKDGYLAHYVLGGVKWWV